MAKKAVTGVSDGKQQLTTVIMVLDVLFVLTDNFFQDIMI